MAFRPFFSFCTRLLASGFFSGYSAIAPGTAGTAVALGIYLLLPPLSIWGWVFLLLGFCIAGVYTSGIGEKAWGKDPGRVVIDEMAGFFVTMGFLPQSAALGLAGFFIFRALDIAKPPPARQAEVLPGGWGIVADDLVAGLYANAALRGILLLWPGCGFLLP